MSHSCMLVIKQQSKEVGWIGWKDYFNVDELILRFVRNHCPGIREEAADNTYHCWFSWKNYSALVDFLHLMLTNDFWYQNDLMAHTAQEAVAEWKMALQELDNYTTLFHDDYTVEYIECW